MGDEEKALRDREAALAAEALAGKNIALEQENARLKEQVEDLTLRLAEAVAASDRTRERSRQSDSGDRVGSRSSDVSIVNAAVLDVNEELNLVVLNAGSEAGLRSGMSFVIVRDGKPVANAEARDVRSRITGAVVQGARAGQYPAPGDRASIAR